MNADFEETLDTVLYHWSDIIGWYKWEHLFGNEFREEETIQIINRLRTDGLLDSSTEGYFLNANGHAIKRQILTKGYVAQKKYEQEMKARQEELLDSGRQKIFVSKLSAYFFFIMLIVLVTVVIIVFNKG